MRTMKRLILTVMVGLIAVGGVMGAEGNLRYSVSVSAFPNESGWAGKWNVGDGFTTIMTDALDASGKFIVLGDAGMRGAALAEQDFAASGRTAGGKKAPKMGRMTPAQLLVRGSITHVQNETTGGKGGLRFKGVSLGGSKGSAEVNLTIYLVDSETGQGGQEHHLGPLGMAEDRRPVAPAQQALAASRRHHLVCPPGVGLHAHHHPGHDQDHGDGRRAPVRRHPGRGRQRLGAGPGHGAGPRSEHFAGRCGPLTRHQR